MLLAQSDHLIGVALYPSSVPDNANSTSSSSMKSRRGRRPSLAPREVVLGLDRLERRVSFFGAGVALLFALGTAIEWARNVSTITKVSPSKTDTCPSGYHHLTSKATSICEEISKTSQGGWEIRFFFILLIALCILYFTVRRKRAGVACFAVFLGLGLGFGTGFIFFLLGVWLIIRAYRLQKYGEAGFVSSNRVAKEMGQAKREGRSVKASSTSNSKDATSRATAAPAASKRYTPKKPPRRRR
jgi:hypothetical protein